MSKEEVISVVRQYNNQHRESGILHAGASEMNQLQAVQSRGQCNGTACAVVAMIIVAAIIIPIIIQAVAVGNAASAQSRYNPYYG